MRKQEIICLKFISQAASTYSSAPTATYGPRPRNWTLKLIFNSFRRYAVRWQSLLRVDLSIPLNPFKVPLNPLKVKPRFVWNVCVTSLCCLCWVVWWLLQSTKVVAQVFADDLPITIISKSSFICVRLSALARKTELVISWN